MLTILSLAIFAGAGQVDWPRGLALGLGNLTGGFIGVRLAVLRGHAWLQRVVTVTVCCSPCCCGSTDLPRRRLVC